MRIDRVSLSSFELLELPVVALAIVLLALVACREPSPGRRALVAQAETGCLCACPEDAPAPSLDAAPDAPAIADASSPPPVNPALPWVRTVITAGAPAGLYRGADGVARDPEGCWVTPWEEGGIVTRACPGPDASWSTELVASGLPGVEDARAADLDGDGVVDVVSCSDAGARCYVTFRGAPNVTITLAGSLGHNHMMQAAIADLNGDGLLDIVVGSRFTSASHDPAAIVVLTNPGAGLARSGAAWVPEVISRAGWTMSLVVVGTRVVVSDRAAYLDAAGATKWDLYGARWLERTPSGWVNHPISPPAGSHAGQTPGDEMFLRVVGDDVWDCTSKLTGANRIAHHHNVTGDWLTWTTTTIPDVANVGHCQGVLAADVDQDGLTDLVVSSWKDNTFPVNAADAGRSGLWWLRADGAGGYTRGELSGPTGGKFDNAEVIGGGPCIITSEQLDPQGGLGVVSYCPGGAPP